MIHGELLLTEEESARLRRVLADPIVGFSTSGGSVRPSPSSVVFDVSHLIVQCGASILITTVSVDVAPQAEVFPIAAHLWEPELVEPWHRRDEAPIDPEAEVGLDLATPLGRIVETSIFTVTVPPFGEVEEEIEFDTGIVLAVGGWRLLIESLEHTEHSRVPMNLALSTDSRAIDERLSQGTVRSVGAPSR